jgi:hypothetical protein
LGTGFKATPQRQLFAEPLSLSKNLLRRALVIPEAGLAAKGVECS